MKNIFLSLVLTKLIFTTFAVISILFILTGCNPNNPQPNTPASTWKIKATINGVTHRAEGNNWDPLLAGSSNSCYALISNEWIISARIVDKSAASYISGDNGTLQFQLTNPSLGVNSLSNCVVYGSWLTDVLDFSGYGYSLTLNGAMVPNSNGGLGPKLPINLTSLGSAGNGQYANSQPVKGNYTGTIYVQSSLGTASGFDTPVNLDIEFEAIRP